MKLGTKIILGFLITCGIFMVLSGYIIFALLGVQSDITALQTDTSPTNDLNDSLRYNIAAEAIDIVTYSQTGDEAAWKRAQAAYAENLKDVNALITGLAAGYTANMAEIQALGKNAQAKYADYSHIVDDLPDNLKRLNEARVISRTAYEALVRDLAEFRRGQAASQTKELDSLAAHAVLKRRAARIQVVADLESLAGEFYINLLRGLADADVKAFG